MPQGPSQAFHGYGSVVYYGAGVSPDTFTAISEVNSITLPSQDADIFEVTHLTSPSARKEKLAGLIDQGGLTLTANYLPQDASHQAMLALSTSRAIRDFKVVCSDPDDSVWVIPGIVTSANVSPLSVSGAPTITFVITPTSASTLPT